MSQNKVKKVGANYVLWCQHLHTTTNSPQLGLQIYNYMPANI